VLNLLLNIRQQADVKTDIQLIFKKLILLKLADVIIPILNETAHASASMILDTYSHVKDESRISMLKQVEQDFYSQSPSSVPDNDSIDDFITIIKSNPNMQQRFLSALING